MYLKCINFFFILTVKKYNYLEIIKVLRKHDINNNIILFNSIIYQPSFKNTIPLILDYLNLLTVHEHYILYMHKYYI